MDDDELKRIREERLRQLKQQSAGGGGGAAGGGGAGSDEQQQRQQQQQEARQNLLNQILEPDAADRLARIRLVKADRAAAVEDRLLGLAQARQLTSKVTETQLKDLLQRISAAEESSGANRIVVERRVKNLDDDDDFFD